MIEICESTIEDARFIGEHLRAGDYYELLAHRSGINPAIMVIESFMVTPYCRTVKVDGEPAVIFGVVSDDDIDGGVIWMLATPRIMQISRAFLKGCKLEVATMNAMYPFLFNYVHEHNDVSKNWLKWLGFTIDEQSTDAYGFQFFWKGK